MNKIRLRQYIMCLLLFWGNLNAGYTQAICEELKNKMDSYKESTLDSNEAEKLFEEYQNNNCVDMVFAYTFLGYIYYNISEITKAKEYLLLGEKAYFEEKSAPEQYAYNQLYTAFVLNVEQDYNTALFHLNKAKNLVKESNDKYLQAIIFQNLGLVNILMNKNTQAESYLNEALKIGGLDSIAIGYLYQNLALLNLKKGNKGKTQKYIELSKNIRTKLNDAKGKYYLSFVEAKFAILNKEYKKALHILKLGRSAYDNKDKLFLGEHYLIEANAHHQLGRKKEERKAFEFAILNNTDLSASQLQGAIKNITEIQESTETVELLSQVISELKTNRNTQQKISASKNELMDNEISEGKSLIIKQLGYMATLTMSLFVLFFLLLRVRKQNSHIIDLNKELKYSNAEIQSQNNKLKQKNKELEQFAYVASHDLKSPLRTISGFAGLVRKNIEQKDKVNTYLDFIISASNDMTSMISDLLHHSTMDQEVNYKNSNIVKIIDKAVLRLDEQIKEAKAIVNVDKNCNPIIQCEENQISVVIQNLVSNAINYCKEDVHAIINITITETTNHINISILDNGIGIPKEYQEAIFKMFNRLKEKKVSGTGIGLATCKKIIKRHNGSIKVESEFGKGAEFLIKLPKHQTKQ